MSTRTIIVYTRRHAEAALAAAQEANISVALSSPPGAAVYMGAAMFREMIRAAREAYPQVNAQAILDCGSEPGLALNALRQGIEIVCVDVPDEVLAKLVDIATQVGARVISPREKPDGDELDLLGADDPSAVCRQWLKPSADS